MFAHLKLLSPSDCLKSQEKYGVYVLKSRDSDVFYRVGACGVKDKGTISGRFKTHRGARPKDNILWTNQNKPWDPIWCISLIDADRSLTGVAERLLYIAMARNFQITDTSGFLALPAQREAVTAVANESAEEINAFIQHYKAKLGKISQEFA